jgi:hypothetical protein
MSSTGLLQTARRHRLKPVEVVRPPANGRIMDGVFKQGVESGMLRPVSDVSHDDLVAVAGTPVVTTWASGLNERDRARRERGDPGGR